MARIEKDTVGTLEIARAFGVSQVTVRTRLEKGEIPGVKFGRNWRVSRGWLEAELQKLRGVQ